MTTQDFLQLLRANEIFAKRIDKHRTYHTVIKNRKCASTIKETSVMRSSGKRTDFMSRKSEYVKLQAIKSAAAQHEGKMIR